MSPFLLAYPVNSIARSNQVPIGLLPSYQRLRRAGSARLATSRVWCDVDFLVVSAPTAMLTAKGRIKAASAGRRR